MNASLFLILIKILILSLLFNAVVKDVIQSILSTSELVTKDSSFGN